MEQLFSPFSLALSTYAQHSAPLYYQHEQEVDFSDIILEPSTKYQCQSQIELKIARTLSRNGPKTRRRNFQGSSL